MNTKQAADLAQEILEDDTHMFLDWAAFEAWFILEFMHPDEA